MSVKFDGLKSTAKQSFIHESLASAVKITNSRALKILLIDAFEKASTFAVEGYGDDSFLVEISSRRMGLDPGKDTLVHVDQILERALHFMKGEHPETNHQ